MFETFLQRGEHLAEVQAQRALLRFLNGVEWLIRDPKELVGRTPYEVVYRRHKLELRRYHLRTRRAPRFDLPVLLVPPLMVKPFILDLWPGRSLVRFLLARGFDVFLVDFGEPDAADAYLKLDDYVLDWLPTACAQVRLASGSRELSLLGYCMGGLFCLMYLGVTRDRAVRNLITIGAPLDAGKMGLFAWAAKIGGGQIEFLARRIGNVPAGLTSTVFRLLSPARNLTRYADLFLNLWDLEYVNGFDAMNQWIAQFVDYPQGAFLQFVHDFMERNELVEGRMRFGGKVADLRRIRASLLAFAGRTERGARPASVRAQVEAVGSSDVTFVLAPGGHTGVLAGRSAPKEVWRPLAPWVAPRSTARRLRASKGSRPATARRVRRTSRHARRSERH